MSKYSKSDRQAAIERLREWVKPGDTIHTILRNTSRSGMSRTISPVVNSEDISFWVARALDMSIDQDRGGIKISGCGMDMGFALVYDLSRTLFPNGFGDEGELPLGHKIRPPTKEKAAQAVAKGAKFHGRNGDTSGWDNDGGYALKQRWL